VRFGLIVNISGKILGREPDRSHTYQNWTALHVWLYLFWKKAKYNPLYEEGFDRIGCWLCPSASMADFSRLGEIHPELSQKLEKYLKAYASRNGLSEEWVSYGFWRWQSLPKSIRMIAEKKGINIVQQMRKDRFILQ